MVKEDERFIVDYLKNSIVSPDAKEQLLSYINEAFYRLLHTLRLIPNIKNGKMLEIGANPYFLTLLIKKYRDYELSLINYFGDDFVEDTQRIYNEKYREEHVFRFENVNIKKTPCHTQMNILMSWSIARLWSI
ncbi:hypothetical protein [Methanocella conradii]|uniref:hypothetical protein n=1 Tax=Methanocella conradii TaxID=1175444 RepID=UPI00157C6459|nr:hypothetical protein [Methanocella conradii]